MVQEAATAFWGACRVGPLLLAVGSEGQNSWQVIPGSRTEEAMSPAGSCVQPAL